MKSILKSDSGYALGLVLIFVLGVGSVLGSVMMITQLSADAQGRGVDQLMTANAQSVSNAESAHNFSAATSEVIESYTQAAAEGRALSMAQNAENCGLPQTLHGINISCSVVPSSDATKNQVDRVLFAGPSGKIIEQTFGVVVDPTSGTQVFAEVRH